MADVITIAVEGCCHGDLDKIYDAILRAPGRKVDLLICCGDFQATRNAADLMTMSVPPKYRAMKDFHKYYSGAAEAPVPTIFIGGNHEASNHLQELPYGGYVAKNIFFLGNAGVVNFGGLRIGGVSGIFKSGDYRRGVHEQTPYTDGTMRSVYHTRAVDAWRLLHLMEPLDVFLSHDWPRMIEQFGDAANTANLLRRKKHFAEDIAKHELGSASAALLLHELRPEFWFSAHLHVKFAVSVQHPPQYDALHASRVAESTREAVLGGVRPGAGSAARAAAGRSPDTKFLALDKCLPGRDYLQILTIPVRGCGRGAPREIMCDVEWLAILRATHAATPLHAGTWAAPDVAAVPDEAREWVRAALAPFALGGGWFRWPAEFRRSAPVYGAGGDDGGGDGRDGDDGSGAADEDLPFQFGRGGGVPGGSRGGRGRGFGGRGGGGGRGRGRGRGGARTPRDEEPVPEVPQPVQAGNPQMDDLLRLLGLPHITTIATGDRPRERATGGFGGRGGWSHDSRAGAYPAPPLIPPRPWAPAHNKRDAGAAFGAVAAAALDARAGASADSAALDIDDAAPAPSADPSAIDIDGDAGGGGGGGGGQAASDGGAAGWRVEGAPRAWKDPAALDIDIDDL